MAPAVGSFDYQWYRSGKKIPGAAKPTYKLVAKDAEKKMAVKITGWVPSRLSTVRASTPTPRVAKAKLTKRK